MCVLLCGIDSSQCQRDQTLIRVPGAEHDEAVTILAHPAAEDRHTGTLEQATEQATCRAGNGKPNPRPLGGWMVPRAEEVPRSSYRLARVCQPRLLAHRFKQIHESAPVLLGGICHSNERPDRVGAGQALAQVRRGATDDDPIRMDFGEMPHHYPARWLTTPRVLRPRPALARDPSGPHPSGSSSPSLRPRAPRSG
jgi:hypothetical protein